MSSHAGVAGGIWCGRFVPERERVQSARDGSHIALGKLNLDHRLAQFGVAEQQLDGAQIGAAF